MNKSVLLSALSVIALSGCATSEDACRDVNEIAEQAQQCALLQRQIQAALDKPLVRTELERRLQTDCIDVHYYRDDRQEAVCGNKKQIEEAIKEHEKKITAEEKK